MTDFASIQTSPTTNSVGISHLIGRSFTGAVRSTASTSGTGRPVKYGDRIHVKVARVQPGGEVIAEMVLDNVNDLSDVYGELRFHTRGKRGLTSLYVRNITRGWSFSQPFMLYADSRRPAVSVAHPLRQPVVINERQSSAASRHSSANAPRQSGHRREIPESIRLLFGEH